MNNSCLYDSNKINYMVRFDPEEKMLAENIVNELGLTLSSALNIYLREIVRCNGIPFKQRVEHYNKETRDALNENLSDKTPMNYEEFVEWCECLKKEK